MDKDGLLFYNEYEEFYAMAENSRAFHLFCEEALGEDFSQDGFSDLSQVKKIIKYIPDGSNVHILDIGCGNGKMLGYVQKVKDVHIHGFDFSAQAVNTARKLYPVKSDFKEGIAGKTEYKENSFDVIISMDTMYFADDMAGFMYQVKKWLKEDGVFFAGYQEGDIMPKTRDATTTMLAKALEQNNMVYETEDITMECYDMLKRKRSTALKYKEDFKLEGNAKWFDMLMGQTEICCLPFAEFKEKMARYIFTAKKCILPFSCL
ncbi:MAG: class I SAM-dependent methyltransferase [Lachnospiraceae bacterium]|nr:class I SAM-dependent methyltransferase [Lachnospiraceae bacterium]